MIKEEDQGSRNGNWFKSFEKNLIANLTKLQEFFLTWRHFLLSAEFWSLAWLWRAFWLRICSLRISLSLGGSAKRALMTWVSNRVPDEYLEKEFPDCLKSGVLLCALIEKIVPGACPRHDLLDPDQSIRNLKLAFHLIEKYFKIKPPITVREILQDEGIPEKRLLLLLAQIKTASEMFRVQTPSLEPPKELISQTTFVSEKCFARGMGLLLAVRGRKACFTIILDSMEELDMVIEIRGPNNTACSKRISSAYSLSKNESSEARETKESFIQENIMNKQIPLEYTILGRKISIRYTPIESGEHSMSIIWQGQHIMGSPYTITVDNSVDAPDIWHKPSKRSLSPLRKVDFQEFNGSGERKKFASHPKSRGTITRKRIIRYIVKMEGNDVIIDGKEDLCEAINKIKRQQKKTPSTSDESFESTKDSDSLLNEDDVDIENNTDFDHKVPKEFNCERLTYEFKEDQLSKADSSDLVNEDIANLDSRTEEYDENYLDEYYKSGIKDEKLISDRENVDHHEIKSIGDIFKLQSFNTTAEVYTRSSSEESENSDVRFNDVERKNLINQRNRPKKKNKTSVFESKRVRQQSNANTNSFSDNDMNVDRSPPSSSEVDLFFPVHKVQYEMLHDDDEDTDDHSEYHSKRRTSFTELHESNYLDEEIEEMDMTDIGAEENFKTASASPINFNGYEVHKNATKHYGAEDMRNCLRANHDLFQCDHSLSFWSETVTSTPLDFERNSLESNPEINSFNALENTESAASGFDRMLLELGDIVSSETFSVGCEETNPLENSFFELKDSDFYTPISFSPEETEENKHNENDLELLKKYLMRELPDNKRRISWPERDILPSIQESSFEGIMDIENYNDKMKNKEIRENSNSSLNITKNLKKCEDPSLSDSPSPDDDKTNILEDILEQTSEENALSVDNTDKSTSPLKTVTSDNCNRKENPRKKLSEIKFTTCTYLERNQTHFKSGNGSSISSSSNSNDLSNKYILTRATPVIIEDNSELSPELQEQNLSALDYKPPQCLSVKRVVQIFQKEKEEPLDTWPNESQNSKPVFKTFKDDVLRNKMGEKTDLLHFGKDRFSQEEISRSSIKDRVKIFESDEIKDTASTRTKNNDKLDGSTISAKKIYWESITS